MRVLYGVCGEGMGHAIRSAVVADHLRAEGHQVLFCTSGRALRHLWGHGDCITVPSLTLAKDGGEIQALDTIVRNAIHQALGAVFEAPGAASAVLRFRPEAVVSDFEPWSARYARLSGTPLYAVDSIHFLSRCAQPPELMTRSATIAAAVTSAMVPFADRYLVAPLAFGRGAPLDERTTVYPPILRPAILRARTMARGQHLTVYLNQLDDETLRVLAGGAPSSSVIAMPQVCGLPCHIWTGTDRAYLNQGNLSFHPFSERAFIDDLATCRACIGSAGALMGEAAYLQRPMLALPIAGQGEQENNAAHLQRDGYGEACARLTSGALANFLERAPFYQRNLQTIGHDENRALFAALDRCLAGGAP